MKNLAREPALNDIEPAYFVKQILLLTGTEQLESFLSISRRLEETNEAVFSAELPWARDVIQRARAAATAEPALRQARILKMADWVSQALDQREGVRTPN
jgi:hypothetical protein